MIKDRSKAVSCKEVSFISQEGHWHFLADYFILLLLLLLLFFFLLTFLLFVFEVVSCCVDRIIYCILCLGLPDFSSSERVVLISDCVSFWLNVWRRPFLPQFLLRHQYNWFSMPKWVWAKSLFSAIIEKNVKKHTHDSCIPWPDQGYRKKSENNEKGFVRKFTR